MSSAKPTSGGRLAVYARATCWCAQMAADKFAAREPARAPSPRPPANRLIPNELTSEPSHEPGRAGSRPPPAG
jgi:hypothetical protein